MTVIKVIAAISGIIMIVLGAITITTDLLYHKAFNRHLVWFASAGLVIQIVSCCMDPGAIGYTLLNLVISVVAALLFFALKIWAAGDAKLFITYVLLIPYPVYGAQKHQFFPAFLILGFIFSTALLYVVMESLVLFVRDVRAKKQAHQAIPHFTLEMGLLCLMGFLAADTMDCILKYIGSDYILENNYFLLLMNILLITALSSLNLKRLYQFILVACLAVSRVILAYWTGITFSSISVWTILAVTIIIIARVFTSQYNYQTIPTVKVREGHVLSKTSLLYMLPSKVKGLPSFTDETTRSRLTADEVEAIRRWETSKYGQHEITIVRHIPFAPFIFLGVMCFIAFKLYLGVLQ